MKKFQKKALTGFAISVSAVALLAGAPVFAQDAGEEEEVTVDEAGAEGEDTGERIVVTGSRLRTTTYNSPSPLQILSTEASRDVGEFDAAEILQRSESAAGQQIDATFQGFVLNNGPGSQTLNLRGLGADRTLLLINGRRMAPAGVEGAPTSPSINLLPTSLIARYELLLDGASSVYGSDAVAGVGNIILRDDIDGFEVFASGNYNEMGGGDDYTISGAWGRQFSNGFIGIGAEYSRRDTVRIGDRDFLSGCNRHYEIDQDGNILTNDVRSDANTRRLSNGTIREPVQPCKIDRAARRIIPSGLFFSSIYFDEEVYASTGQAGNSFIPFFTDGLDAFGRPTDRNGDGMLDVDFSEVTRNGNELDVEFIAPEDRYNVMAYGEYTFDGDMNITPFFEAMYSRADVTVSNGGTPQLFPIVAANNPFNPCNIINNDCGLAQNRFDGLTGTVNARPLGRSYAAQPVVNVRGDRNNVESTLEQYRGVLGLRGDLPFIGDTWGFELAGTYSRSEGASNRRGIRVDKLALALGQDPTVPNPVGRATPITLAGGPCATSGFFDPSLVQPDLLAGCVPVNMFAPSLYQTIVGDFATEAERNYLFGDRTFDTTYEQIVVNAFVSGDLVELPAGPLSVLVGAEYREDTLNSQPGAVAAQGLFFGFFADEGAQGSKYLVEAFGEVNIPVFDDDFWGELNLGAAGRLTHEEFYGSAETYSLEAGWSPIPSVLLKATYGTSFRAPNLRENFLGGQSGFGGILDPCAIPVEAYNALGGGYNAANDTRAPEILANCRREGRDPTRVGVDSTGVNTVTVPSVEITSGGSLELDPETSTSFTTGVSITESLGAFDFSFNFNYYNINVEGAIAEPTGQFVVNECYLRDDGVRSSLCDFIEFDTDPASRQLITGVFAGFININEEVVKGLDFNAGISRDFNVGTEVLELGLDLRANHLIERSTLFLDDQGNPDLDEQAGEFGFPSWTGRLTFTADYSDFGFTWQTRYIGSVAQDPNGVDEFSDAFGRGPDGRPTGFISDTCLGNGSGTYNPVTDTFTPDGRVQGDGVFCRNVGFAGDYFVHTVSLRYTFNDNLTVRAGVTNVFNEDPPLIDTAEVFGIANTPIGNGYDLNGREFFGSVSFTF